MLGECLARASKQLGHHSYVAYLIVEGVDQFHAEVAERGAEVLSRSATEPWGLRSSASAHRTDIASDSENRRALPANSDWSRRRHQKFPVCCAGPLRARRGLNRQATTAAGKAGGMFGSPSGIILLPAALLAAGLAGIAAFQRLHQASNPLLSRRCSPWCGLARTSSPPPRVAPVSSHGSLLPGGDRIAAASVFVHFPRGQVFFLPSFVVALFFGFLGSVSQQAA